jgi:hypothetical protein
MVPATSLAALSATETKLTASDAAAGDFFGVSVALSGDTAVVGARFHDDTGRASGSAYVFELAADSDGDGLPDASDPDTVAALVTGLDPRDFSAPGHRIAILSRLDGAPAQVLAGNVEEAIRQLENLQRRVDGCVTAGVADSNDWIRPLRRAATCLAGDRGPDRRSERVSSVGGTWPMGRSACSESVQGWVWRQALRPWLWVCRPRRPARSPSEALARRGRSRAAR